MFYAKRIRNFLKTITFQLTAWYVFIFAISSAVVFIIFYIMMNNSVYRRTDIYLLKKAEEMRALFSSSGFEALKREIVRETNALGTETTFYRLVTGKGEVLASSDISAWRGVDVDREIINMVLSGEPAFKTIQVLKSEDYHLEARLLYTRLGDGIILQMGFSLRDEVKLLESFREVFGTAMLIMLTIAGLGGWFLAHRALGRVANVTAVAREISRGALERRVPLAGTGDEIDQLASTFNEMLDHIQKLVMEMREVTDNIAHDLRSPITGMRGSAEVMLMQERTPQEYQEVLVEIISECDRLLSLINITLDISEAESGAMKLNLARVNLTDIAVEVGEMFRPAAEEKGVTLDVKSEHEALILADSQRLRQVIVNLVDNAVKYTPPGGNITISVEFKDAVAILSVSDTGVGIPQTEIPKIFQRFYRSDRSRSVGGFGLGLSVAQAIVHAHGGEIHVESSPGKGSAFKVLLPLL